jgi:hypothetical protein
MVFNKKINEYQENFFDIFIIISYILVFVSFLGLSPIAKTFSSDLDYYIRIYICLFLIWRFHPFRTIDKFTNLDRKIAFSAGLFILTTTALNKYILDIKDKLGNIFKTNSINQNETKK